MEILSKLEIIKKLDIFNIIYKLLNSKNLSETTLFNLGDIVNSLGLFVLDSQLYYKEKNLVNSELYGYLLGLIKELIGFAIIILTISVSSFNKNRKMTTRFLCI